MSEYQYYEFLAVDRPLTVAEQAEVRLDPDLLEAAAEASPALPEVQDDARLLAAYVAKLSVSDKDRLLILVAEDQAARARTELLRGFRGDPDERRSRPRRTVAGLLDAAAARRMRREQAAAAAAAVQQALREQQRAAARQRRLDELAQDAGAAWAEAEQLISAKQAARYAAAVTLLRDPQELAQRDGQAQAFARRLMALRDAHLRKPSLIAGSTEPDSPPDCGPGALPRLLTCCLPLGEASVKPGI